jgi:hypothetical protein
MQAIAPALVKCREPPAGNASIAARITGIGYTELNKKIVYTDWDAMD